MNPSLSPALPAVRDAVNAWDPFGLISDENPDEYESEIRDLAEQLPGADSPDAAAHLVAKVFRESFGDDRFSPASCRDVGRRLFHALREARPSRMDPLDQALAIAARAHAGQLDRAGQPYILHPLRIMLRLDTTDARVVALLHDVVEDSDWTLERLRAEGFSETVVAAVDHLTRRKGERYDAFIERLLPDALAARVKQFDLEDNMALTRLADLDEIDAQRLLRYHLAWRLVVETHRGGSPSTALTDELRARLAEASDDPSSRP